MGFWRNFLMGESLTPSPEAAPTFAVTPADVPAEVFGLETYTTTVPVVGKVSRNSAMQVPAVKRCRDLIAGSLGTLPIVQLDSNLRHITNPLFEQPERDRPRSVTMTRTAEDMLFEGVAWWKVVERSWNGYPTKIVRLEPGTVDVGNDGKVYTTNSGHSGTSYQWVPDRDLIRFDSPNSSLLWAGSRAIQTALNLDAAANRYADGSPPIDFFTPAEGADPADDEDIVDLLNDWQAARRNRSTGYVPAALQYHVAGWDPEKLQLAEARQHAVLEIARCAGVDPEELGVSTTSRTYANQQDRRKNFLDFTLGGYLSALQDRLSMGDVTPRGNTVRVDLSNFLRSDDKTRFEAYELGLRVGAVTPEQIAEREGNPTVNQPAETEPLRAVPATEESA